jgi:hypothetical protein
MAFQSKAAGGFLGREFRCGERDASVESFWDRRGRKSSKYKQGKGFAAGQAAAKGYGQKGSCGGKLPEFFAERGDFCCC